VNNRPVSVGKVGSRTTLTKNKIPGTVEKSEDHIQIELPVDAPVASVGISVSAGMSTEFAREKIEVSAWCTLPSLTDRKSIEATYDTCYSYAAEKAKSSLDRAVKEFFPDLSREDS